MIEFNLCCILLILILLLIVKLYLQQADTKTTHIDNMDNMGNMGNTDMKQLLNNMKINTDIKINAAIEQGIMEGFAAMSGGEGGGGMGNNKIISYINKDSQIKLMLFYKSNCSYCKEFLPTWYKIVNNLPNDVIYEEINADQDINTNKQTNAYNITSVPTIILLINNKQNIYMGKRSYQDIERFLKHYGINLVARSFEDFDDTGYGTDLPTIETTNNNCPAVTFDSQLDVANDDYMFQIFNQNGQYGYAKGGNKEGKLLSPFAAAYSVVDSYLSSIPDSKNMNECATLYSQDIRGFGLCDTDKLNEILSYQENIKNGSVKERISGTNYNTNTDVVASINAACTI